MRSLLAAILTFFLPARGAHRSAEPPSPPPPIPRPSMAATAPERSPLIPYTHPAEAVTDDGMPLVRPYVIEWERERDERDRRLQRERRRAAALASLRQDYVPVPWEVAV